MSDLFKESAADGDIEAKLRAEKIGKIKNSVQKSDGSEWEKELAERIARKVQSVKANKSMDAMDILNQLDAESRGEKIEKAADEQPEPQESAAENTVENFNEAYAEETAAPLIPEAETPRETLPRENTPEPVKPTAAEIQPEKSAAKSKKKKKKKKKSFKERFLGLFPQKGDSVLECIRKIVFLISIIAIIVCGYMVADYYLDLWHSKKINNQVMDMYWTYEDDDWTPPAPEPDQNSEEPDNRPVYHMLSGARKLLDINSEVVGVITIPGTEVNNPVMQASDNFKYLDRKINGDESRAGELFLDYRNHFDDVDEEGHLKYPNSDNLVIYGHNMGDETMFGTLKYYQRNGDYYGKHPLIELNSNYCRYTYKIFSVFILDADDKSDTKFDCWNKLEFEDEDDFYSFVNEAKKRTLRLNDVDVEYGDKLLTLSTCNTLLGDRGRLIVVARLVRDGEDPLEGTQDSVANPNIKWPSVYYDYKEIRPTYDPEAEFVPYGPDKSDEKKSD